MKPSFRLSTNLLLSLTVAMLCTACHDDEVTSPVVQPLEDPTALTDAYHDKIREQPYPKAGNELYLNPAPLIVPQALKSGEKLEFALSRSKLFDTPETLLSEAKVWCFFNPHRALEEGTWYWRFRNLAADGIPGEWSEPIAFEVEGSEPVFVTPSFRTVSERLPNVFPRLYCFLDDRIEPARQTAGTHAEYGRLIGNAEQAIEADFTTGSGPYADLATLKAHIQSLYQAYYLTRQERFTTRLHELLRLLVENPPGDKTLFADNFTSTNIAFCHLMPYDLLHDRLSAVERQGVEELLLRVLRFYYPQQVGTEENHLFDNHFWQQNMRVLFQAAFVLSDHPTHKEEVMPMLEYYYELWTARAPASGFNRDGVWHNGTGYFNNNVRTLCYMPLLFSYLGQTDFLLHPWYRQAGQALSFTCPPNSKNIGFGDGSEKYTATYQYAAFADCLARETRDAYAGWYAGAMAKTLLRDNDMRLYRMASSHLNYATNLPEESPKMVWYRDAGEVAMHSNLAYTAEDLALAFRSSTFGSGSHTCSNQNAFNLLYGGEVVYRSSGYYTSFSDAHNLMSYRHTRAHNTILVNGIGQPFSTKGYGFVARAMGGEQISYCLGDASKAYCGISDDPMWVEAFETAGLSQTPENGFGTTPLTRYRRHVLMLHPDKVVIYDELEADEPVSWQWLLHSNTPFEIDPQTHILRTTQAHSVTTTRIFCPHPLAMEQTDRFVVPPTETPDPAYPDQWHFTAAVEGKAQTRFLTIIQVKPQGEVADEITQSANHYSCGNWEITAALDPGEEPQLEVTHRMKRSSFHYGSGNPVIEGTTYIRAQAGSSVLYDKVEGEYRIKEQGDQTPLSTRALH